MAGTFIYFGGKAINQDEAIINDNLVKDGAVNDAKDSGVNEKKGMFTEKNDEPITLNNDGFNEDTGLISDKTVGPVEISAAVSGNKDEDDGGKNVKSCLKEQLSVNRPTGVCTREGSPIRNNNEFIQQVVDKLNELKFDQNSIDPKPKDERVNSNIEPVVAFETSNVGEELISATGGQTTEMHQLSEPKQLENGKNANAITAIVPNNPNQCTPLIYFTQNDKSANEDEGFIDTKDNESVTVIFNEELPEDEKSSKPFGTEDDSFITDFGRSLDLHSDLEAKPSLTDIRSHEYDKICNENTDNVSDKKQNFVVNYMINDDRNTKILDKDKALQIIDDVTKKVIANREKINCEAINNIDKNNLLIGNNSIRKDGTSVAFVEGKTLPVDFGTAPTDNNVVPESAVSNDEGIEAIVKQETNVNKYHHFDCPSRERTISQNSSQHIKIEAQLLNTVNEIQPRFSEILENLRIFMPSEVIKHSNEPIISDQIVPEVTDGTVNKKPDENKSNLKSFAPNIINIIPKTFDSNSKPIPCIINITPFVNNVEQISCPINIKNNQINCLQIHKESNIFDKEEDESISSNLIDEHTTNECLRSNGMESNTNEIQMIKEDFISDILPNVFQSISKKNISVDKDQNLILNKDIENSKLLRRPLTPYTKNNSQENKLANVDTNLNRDDGFINNLPDNEEMSNSLEEQIGIPPPRPPPRQKLSSKKNKMNLIRKIFGMKNKK